MFTTAYLLLGGTWLLKAGTCSPLPIYTHGTQSLLGLFRMKQISIEGSIILRKMTNLNLFKWVSTYFPLLLFTSFAAICTDFLAWKSVDCVVDLALCVLTAAHVNDNFSKSSAWNITPFHQIFFCLSCQFPMPFYYLSGAILYCDAQMSPSDVICCD